MGFEGEHLVALSSLCLAGWDVSSALAEWLTRVFPVERKAAPRPPKQGIKHIPGQRSKRAERRLEYRRVQGMYLRSPAFVAREILEGRRDTSATPPLEDFVAFWQPIMGSRGPDPPRGWVAGVPAGLSGSLAGIMAEPITASEAHENRPRVSSAPGPDGVTTRRWLSMPEPIRVLALNILLASPAPPEALLRSRTVFIPKGEGKSPADFRPISLTSVVLRHFHRILAKRFEASGVIDLRQRAFRRADGVAECLLVLQSALRHARRSLKPIFVATLDVAKAFDSVSHAAIVESLQAVGATSRFSGYVASIYRGCTTEFSVRGKSSTPIPVGRGVRQGDPLSPLLFNLVLNSVVAALPTAVGFNLAGERLNALLFADDALLLAQTEAGLQDSLNAFAFALHAAGLACNAKKSAVLSLVPSGREKKMKVVEGVFTIGGAPLPALQLLDTWRYLGLQMRVGSGPQVGLADLELAVNKLTKAPLRPQQRLEILRNYFIPTIIHNLVFGRVTLKALKSFDTRIRRSVRLWLGLPPDVPIALFCAPISEGGMAVPTLATHIPALRRSRILRLKVSPWNIAVHCSRLGFVVDQLAWCDRALPGPKTVDGLKKLAARQLHASVDGVELRQTREAAPSWKWVSRSSGRSGRDYSDFWKIRAATFPTRVRCARGGRGEGEALRCRSCGAKAETLAHIIQKCPRTHGGRVLRHDALCATLTGVLKERGWTIEREHLYRLDSGPALKPDIVAYNKETSPPTCVILDAQVVSGAKDLNESNREKIHKYNKPELVAAVAEHHNLTQAHRDHTRILAATLSWRGIWSGQSAEDLYQLGLSQALLGSLSVRTLLGSVLNYRGFMRGTSRFPRKGVG